MNREDIMLIEKNPITASQKLEGMPPVCVQCEVVIKSMHRLRVEKYFSRKNKNLSWISRTHKEAEHGGIWLWTYHWGLRWGWIPCAFWQASLIDKCLVSVKDTITK